MSIIKEEINGLSLFSFETELLAQKIENIIKKYSAEYFFFSTTHITRSYPFLKDMKYYTTAKKIQNDCSDNHEIIDFFCCTYNGRLILNHNEHSLTYTKERVGKLYEDDIISDNVSLKQLSKYFFSTISDTFKDTIKKYSEYIQSIITRFYKTIIKLRFKGKSCRNSLKLFKERFITEILILKYIRTTFVYEAFPGL